MNRSQEEERGPGQRARDCGQDEKAPAGQDFPIEIRRDRAPKTMIAATAQIVTIARTRRPALSRPPRAIRSPGKKQPRAAESFQIARPKKRRRRGCGPPAGERARIS